MNFIPKFLVAASLILAGQAASAQYKIYEKSSSDLFFDDDESDTVDIQNQVRTIYAVKLTDKNNSPYSVDQPQQFLSQKALDRRAKYKIRITEQDIPVNPAYVDAIAKLGFIIQGKSKWLNCVWVECSEDKLQQLKDLPFVDYNYVWRKKQPKPEVKPDKMKRPKLSKTPLDKSLKLKYANASNQIEMLNIQALHNLGFTGNGITIAVLDAGFTRADQLPVFDKMFEDNRVLGIYDFVDNDEIVYDQGNHGMNVLSCIAANSPGSMIGTAPDVSAYLFRTEDENSEFIIEEFNWVEAAEKADSLGVDLIHSSLGYQDFDDDATSYTYDEIDGNTCISTIGADIAASKGIFVNVSAGNEGNDPWKYITAPADADSCMAVGAVDKNQRIAYFSSRGPSHDGRVKPDICAKGLSATVEGVSGHVTTMSGTSFAGPILAGCAACLMQAHPKAPAREVMKAIKLSGSKYKTPDNTYGYGIPDFGVAHKILTKMGY